MERPCRWSGSLHDTTCQGAEQNQEVPELTAVLLDAAPSLHLDIEGFTVWLRSSELCSQEMEPALLGSAGVWNRTAQLLQLNHLTLSKLVCRIVCLLSLDTDIPVLDLSSKLSHQPVLLFLRDPYVLPKDNGNQTCHLLTALY